MLCQRVVGPISKVIITSTEKREAQLLNNDTLLVTVFVDPPNLVLSNEDQKIIAKQVLCRLAMKIEGLESETLQSEFTEQQNMEAAHHFSSSCEDHDYNKYLDKVEIDQMKKRRLDGNEPLNVKLEKFKQRFHQAVEEIKEKYNHTCKLALEELIPFYPKIIRDAARTVTALPPTPASVERFFSALKVIKSKLRASLKEDRSWSRSHVHEKKSSGAGAVSYLEGLQSPDKKCAFTLFSNCYKFMHEKCKPTYFLDSAQQY